MNRINKLVASFPADVGGILVTNPKNQRYLTGVDMEGSGWIFVTAQKTYIVATSLYIEVVTATADASFEVIPSRAMSEIVSPICSEQGIKSVMFEESHVTFAQYENYKKAFGDVELVPAGRIIDQIREFKSADEITTIKRAQSITDAAFAHILPYIKPTATEIDIAVELEFFMRKQGADGVAFDIIAVSGAQSSLPHGKPRNVKLESGFFTVDFGARLNGYCSDMTRTVVIGKADDEMKLLYNTVLTAQKAALDLCAHGVTGAELDKAARDIIESSKFAGRFIHGLGHGTGMNIHEAPSISSGGTTPMAPGHIITIEPGIYLEGKYGCRIEDMVVFTDSGHEIITTSPKELIEL